MSVELADLLTTLTPKLNTPGDARPLFDFSSEAPWIDALASAFWTVKAKGRASDLFASYRINVDGDLIVNIDDDTVDMDREDQELIVLQAGLTAVETKLLSLPTRTSDKAGPVSTERERSSTVMRELLKQKQADLVDALTQLGAGASGAARVQVIDAILVRSGYPGGYAGTYVN